MNIPLAINDEPNGGVVRHYVWDSGMGACRVGWDIGGFEGTSAGVCDSMRNSIWNYVNNPAGSLLTQRGVAAVNGVRVRPQRNFWGAGGALDGAAVESGFGSQVDSGNSCETETNCAVYDQIPRE